jgi:carbamoyltransferase
VLVWDGGMRARLYTIDGASGELRGLGPLAVPQGDCYARFAMQWPIFDAGPLKYRDQYAHLSVAGRAMAYAGLGRCSADGVAALRRAGPALLEHPDPASAFAAECRRLGITAADAIATFEEHIGALLVDELGRRALRDGLVGRNLCLAGGCALNIKWNSAIRASGIFGEVWVPPFPNDAGSAIGAACAALMRRRCAGGLDWTVYAGPGLGCAGDSHPGWRRTPCSIEALAALLHEKGEPVVFLSGRAELGPRALGARSIVAPATDPAMTRRLNEVKRREGYRPVAPVCLEGEEEAVFAPGTTDPYMLFAHRVRPGWAERIPAAVHVDGTARLQTVSPTGHPIGRLVAAYRAVSGIPVLCNTSANRPGEGFFTGVEAATRWGEVPTVWSEGWLYERTPR